MYRQVRTPGGIANMPTAGYPRAALFSALQKFSSVEKDEASTPQPSWLSPFAALGDFASRESSGGIPTMGVCASLHASLGMIVFSLIEIGLLPHPPALASAGPKISRQASGENDFLFVGSG